MVCMSQTHTEENTPPKRRRLSSFFKTAKENDIPPQSSQIKETPPDPVETWFTPIKRKRNSEESTRQQQHASLNTMPSFSNWIVSHRSIEHQNNDSFHVDSKIDISDVISMYGSSPISKSPPSPVEKILFQS